MAIFIYCCVLMGCLITTVLAHFGRKIKEVNINKQALFSIAVCANALGFEASNLVAKDQYLWEAIQAVWIYSKVQVYENNLYVDPNWLVYKFIICAGLFIFGLCGVIVASLSKNLFYILVNSEVILLGLSLGFIFFSVYFQNPYGQAFALIIVGLAAAESAVGLGILWLTFNHYKKLNLAHLNRIKK